MVEFHFESLQMDSKYWIRPRIYRLGIWINVNVYLFMWIIIKSSIKHLFFLLQYLKQICSLMCILMSESFHNLN
jgi:hypothetical protein